MRQHLGWGIAGVGLVCVLANACSSDRRPSELDETAATVAGTSTKTVSGPCQPEGSTRACHVALASPGDAVKHCAAGVQECRGGVWGPCGGGSTTSFDAALGVQPAQAQSARVSIPALQGIVESVAARDRLDQVLRLFAPAAASLTATTGRGLEAHVELPAYANGAVHVENRPSHVAVAFALRGASAAPVASAHGVAVYMRALEGGDVIERVTAEGAEDFAVFDTRPAREELVYDLDVSRVAGLRLVANTLELLDASGTPRLRVAPPSIVDAQGARGDARLSLDGCAADTDPGAPWGRPVVAPGAERCTVRVAWGRAGLSYPVLVDPAWTTTGSMAVARESFSASLLGTGLLLVAGGHDGSTYLGSAELYDPSTGTFAATGSMAVARASHLSAAFGSGAGLVLVAGGTDGSSPLSSAEIYDASKGTFTTTGSLNVARSAPRATVLSTTSNVLVTGGVAASGPTSSAEYFDATQGAFTAIGSMGQARAYHAALELSPGTVLVTGGTPDGSALLKSAEMYTEAQQTFTTLSAAMTAPRARHAMTRLTDGRVLVTGSFSSATQTSSASAEIFDPTRSTFAATGAMATGRGNHVARLLPAGKVLVAGGHANASATASAEIYDTVAKTFTTIASMTTPRVQHSAITMSNGKTVVMGGDDGTRALSSAEVLAVPAGARCSADADCISGTCNDGICCAGACSGACTACAPGTGQCTTVTAAADPDTCTGANWCDALGQCNPVPNPCLNDPCDPYCQTFPSDAGNGLTTPAGAGGSFSAAVGLGATPAGFASKELCQPCTGPFPQTCGSFRHYNSFDACESDYHCDQSSGSCVQNGAGWTWPSSVCPGVDLTVEASCSGGSSYVFPVCNRGNTAVAAGTTLAFYIVNGNLWSVNPNTCPTLSTSCSYKLPSPLLPGTCQSVSTCSWVGNSVAYVNANNAVTECAGPTGPGCGDNWSDIKAGAGACQTVSSYTPAEVTQQYLATCGTGTHAQWNFLTYDTVVSTNASGSSDVKFEARTAPILPGNAIGPFTAYTTVADAIATSPAVCQSPCATDLFQKLGGAPTATNAVLNLRITVSPTPDGQASGTLQSYQLTYDCVPSE